MHAIHRSRNLVWSLRCCHAFAWTETYGAQSCMCAQASTTQLRNWSSEVPPSMMAVLTVGRCTARVLYATSRQILLTTPAEPSGAHKKYPYSA